MSRILVIDVGNTYTTWGVYEDKVLLSNRSIHLPTVLLMNGAFASKPPEGEGIKGLL